LKIALVTDTHFGARNDNQNVNDYFYKFYDDIFFPELKKRGITTCVHLGDVVDRRKFISFKIANDFRQRFINRLQSWVSTYTSSLATMTLITRTQTK